MAAPLSQQSLAQLVQAIATLGNQVQQVVNVVQQQQEQVQRLSETIARLVEHPPPPPQVNIPPQPPVQMPAPIITGGTFMTPGIEKPSKFKGDEKDVAKVAASARSFIARFTSWALQQPGLNNQDAQGNNVPNQQKWIVSFLSFLDSDAADWAVPFHEELVGGRYPFGGEWLKCKKAFETRFSVISAGESAREAIKHVHQGKGTVAAYEAEFKQHAEKTGYGEEALRERYYQGLSDFVKKTLIGYSGSKKTLAELYEAAANIDKGRLDFERSKGTGKIDLLNGGRGNSHASSSDPNAMDIDALRSGSTRTRAQWLRSMMGKCFNCGSSQHSATDKAKCPAQGKHCSYCGRQGHFEVGCLDKFTGRERQRGLRSPDSRSTTTTTTSSTRRPSDRVVRGITVEEVPSMTEEDAARALDGYASELKKLQQQQEFAMAQISALKKQGF